MHTAITHFVFVDFENVPTVDLGLIGGKPVQVTLLIGKKQTWLDLPLVQQIRRLADQVELIEVGASGHNALDLTLGYYLGQAVMQSPKGHFFIVSKDKDFDPLVAHLKANKVQVSRHDAFAALPFLSPPKKSTPPKPVVSSKPVASVRPAVPAKPPVQEDRLEKLIGRLRTSSAPRPKKKSSLLARISTDFGNKLDAAGQQQKLDELIRRGIVSIDAQDKVSYS